MKPVEIDESKFNAMDYGIWTFPSFHIYIGSVAAGKSTLLHNLVTRFLYPIFENRIILIQSHSTQRSPHNGFNRE